MNTELKDIGDVMYKSALVSTAVTASRYATKELGFKDRPIELKLKSVAMLALDIGIGMYLVNKLQENKILPKSIFS